jgi:hypothetical protein
MIRRTILAGLILLTSCALQDSHTAARAERRMIGLSEVDLESCLGVPDQHASFGNVDLVTYDATSTGSGGLSIDVPVFGGISFSGSGYCRATFKLVNRRVTDIHFSGEKDAMAAPNAYCAPIVRSCLHDLDAHDPALKAQQKLPEAWRTE